MMARYDIGVFQVFGTGKKRQRTGLNRVESAGFSGRCLVPELQGANDKSFEKTTRRFGERHVVRKGATRRWSCLQPLERMQHVQACDGLAAMRAGASGGCKISRKLRIFF